LAADSEISWAPLNRAIGFKFRNISASPRHKNCSSKIIPKEKSLIRKISIYITSLCDAEKDMKQYELMKRDPLD
jgi:hypothetical protein